MSHVALITGITGQDGSYLAEFLLERKYFVHGIIRRASCINTHRIDHIIDQLHLYHGDLTDSACLIHVLEKIKQKHPDRKQFEVYNLAAQSHVKVSFDMPEFTSNVDALGTIRLLEALRSTNLLSTCRFYQASTSELYGKVGEHKLQNEDTPFNPVSPYAISKLFAHHMVRLYRDAYGAFCCCGILFNHESERRGITFVTRKITIGIRRILRGEIQKITLGNLDSKRDWGYAPDFCEGMWMMLQQDRPDDYVLATRQQHTVREFTEQAFKVANIPIIWSGSGLKEVGKDAKGIERVCVDAKYFRPCEVDELMGNFAKANLRLRWEPRTNFDSLVRKMVEHDMKSNEIY